MERWKWFPEDFGENYIFINIPEYKLHFVFENDTLETKRVVVGKPSRKTPILTSKITNLVFNPTWTVPPTILKEDLLPSASKNISYFTRNRITILNSKKDTIKPKDWDSEKYKSYKNTTSKKNANKRSFDVHLITNNRYKTKDINYGNKKRSSSKNVGFRF